MYGPYFDFLVPSYSSGGTHRGDDDGSITVGGSFRIEGTVLEIGLLLPAVQKVTSAAGPVTTYPSEAPRGTTTVSDDVWIDGTIITPQLFVVDSDRDGTADAFVFDLGDVDGDGRNDRISLDVDTRVVAEDMDRDGVPDSFWIDLGSPVADDGPTCDPSANPILIVVANEDFWFNE